MNGFEEYKNKKKNLEVVRHNAQVCLDSNGEVRFNHVFIDLARICNLKCHGCFKHLDKERNGERIAYKEVQQVLDFAYERGARVLVIAGAGEPTMDPDFKRIIEYTNERGMSSAVFTNGTTLNENLSDFIFGHNVTLVIKRFSVDEGKHDFLVGVNGASQAMLKGLEALVQVKQRRERQGRQCHEIVIESYISQENLEDLPGLLRYCRRMGFVPYFEAFISNGNKHLEPSQTQLTSVFEELARIDREEFGIDTKLKEGARVYGQSKCISGRAGFAVNVYGDVYECVSGKHRFGNIRKNTLPDIFSTGNQNIRDFYLNPCDGCNCSRAYSKLHAP